MKRDGEYLPLVTKKALFEQELHLAVWQSQSEIEKERHTNSAVIKCCQLFSNHSNVLNSRLQALQHPHLTFTLLNALIKPPQI